MYIFMTVGCTRTVRKINRIKSRKQVEIEIRHLVNAGYTIESMELSYEIQGS